MQCAVLEVVKPLSFHMQYTNARLSWCKGVTQPKDKFASVLQNHRLGGPKICSRRHEAAPLGVTASVQLCFDAWLYWLLQLSEEHNHHGVTCSRAPQCFVGECTISWSKCLLAYQFCQCSSSYAPLQSGCVILNSCDSLAQSPVPIINLGNLAKFEHIFTQCWSIVQPLFWDLPLLDIIIAFPQVPCVAQMQGLMPQLHAKMVHQLGNLGVEIN